MTLRKRVALYTILLAFPILVHAQNDYQYDYNGNLVQDVNKQIAAIHYNFLNLADTITFTDGRTIVYTYTASGLKLKQQVIQADGSLHQKKVYTGNMLYKNDTLEQVHHPEGRIAALLPSTSFATPVYQYHLTDHLGNVRLTCTSRRDTLAYLATLENGSLEQENQLFEKLDKGVACKAANHTPKGSRALPLKAGEKSAAVLCLSVRKGDVIVAETYSYYEKGSKDNTKKIADVLIPTLIAPLTGGVSAGELINSSANSNLQGLGAHSMAVVEDDVPQAYLNYQLFDKNYEPIDGGFQRVTQAGNFSLEKVSLNPIVIKESGYLRVYLSNTSSDGQVVYFDDLNVTYIPVPIIQEDSFDPFGMPIAEMHDQREEEVVNRHLFNRKELQDDLGLNVYDYGARIYDATSARWAAIDPKAEKYNAWSPYQYVMNNPINYIDPDGKNAEAVVDNKNKTLTIRAHYYYQTSDEKEVLDRGLEFWNDLSGKRKVTVNGLEYTLNFNLTAIKYNTNNQKEKSLRLHDPIGNSFALVDKMQPKHQHSFGTTTLSSKIEIREEVSNVPSYWVKAHLIVGHEIGHTLLAMEGDFQHIDGTVMDFSTSKTTNKINDTLVNSILMTYGLLPRASNIPWLKPFQHEENMYSGNNFFLKRQ